MPPGIHAQVGRRRAPHRLCVFSTRQRAFDSRQRTRRGRRSLPRAQPAPALPPCPGSTPPFARTPPLCAIARCANSRPAGPASAADTCHLPHLASARRLQFSCFDISTCMQEIRQTWSTNIGARPACREGTPQVRWTGSAGIARLRTQPPKTYAMPAANRESVTTLSRK